MQFLLVLIILCISSLASAADFENDQIFLRVEHENNILEFENTNRGVTQFRLISNWQGSHTVVYPFDTHIRYYRDTNINGIGLGIEKTYWHNKFSYFGIGMDLNIEEPNSIILNTTSYAGLEYKPTKIILLNAEFGLNYQMYDNLNYNWVTNYLIYGAEILLDNTTSVEFKIVEDRNEQMQIQNTNARIGLVFRF